MKGLKISGYFTWRTQAYDYVIVASEVNAGYELEFKDVATFDTPGKAFEFLKANPDPWARVEVREK